ncbi:MAG: hypothetical protein SWJ54_06045 [Cyanobacteriota bacterium]|nr:hypothetical protein [Cyanobacteriota bacterium]
MFAQFRSRYPTGSLISELLAIDHGKYVVRVLVEVEGVTISSGLAAAETVELAEDQARKRSLQVLGIETATTLPSFSTPASLSGTENSAPLELNSAPEFAQLPEATSVESDTKPSLDISDSGDWSSEGTASEDWLSATYINSGSSSKSSPTEASLPPIPETPADESNEVPATVSEDPPSKPSTSKTSKKRKSKTTIESTDFSSEITRTNLELKRLGWTTEQGVEHLQKTYGKRSRHQLTEDELLDFLHYLESLPTPSPQDEM